MKKVFKNSLVTSALKKLKEIGQHGSGTFGEMKMRLGKFSLYPKLYQRLNKAQSTTKYKFQSSLDPNEVPNISAKWCPDESFILQLMTTFLMYTATLKVHSQVRDNFWQLKAL